MLRVRNHLRTNRRKNYAEVLKAGCNRDVYGTWYCIVFCSGGGGKGEQQNLQAPEISLG